jgi:putative transposase
VAQYLPQGLQLCIAGTKDWVNSRKCDINSCSIKQEYMIPADALRPTFAGQCKSLAFAKKLIPELKLR